MDTKTRSKVLAELVGIRNRSPMQADFVGTALRIEELLAPKPEICLPSEEDSGLLCGSCVYQITPCHAEPYSPACKSYKPYEDKEEKAKKEADVVTDRLARARAWCERNLSKTSTALVVQPVVNCELCLCYKSVCMPNTDDGEPRCGTFVAYSPSTAKIAEGTDIAKWGIEQCQAHYKGGGVISKRECPECWKSLSSTFKEKEPVSPDWLGGEFKLFNMCGRPVAIRRVGNYDLTIDEKCGECGQPVKYRVYEITPHLRPEDNVWSWCGQPCGHG